MIPLNPTVAGQECHWQILHKFYRPGIARKYTGGSDQWGDRAESRDSPGHSVGGRSDSRDSALLGNLQSTAFLWQHVLDSFFKNAETIHSNRVNLVWEFSHTLIVIQRMIELLFFMRIKRVPPPVWAVEANPGGETRPPVTRGPGRSWAKSASAYSRSP